MSWLVRTWNLFHGRTVPETRELHLEAMVRLVSDGGPAVVALQEVPVWALRRLGAWSGMHVVSATAMPALAGPLARRLTGLDPRRLRSSLSGQANALLLRDGVGLVGPQQVVRLNPPGLRRSNALARREQVDWARNRRVCQIVPVEAADLSLHVVNLHATKHRAAAELELERLTGLLPAGRVVLCGDLNVPGRSLPGFSQAISGIDQILVRGLDFERPPAPWADDRRRRGAVLLSDHAPVEAIVRVGSRGS